MSTPVRPGLLLTARDLVFGVIDFGLYYTLLTNLYFVRFGTRGRIQTYDLPLRRRLLLFAELLGLITLPILYQNRF